MYARIATLLRPLILWLLTLAQTAISFWIIDKVLETMLKEIQEYYEISDEDSRIIVANQLIDGLGLVIGGTATIASKIPIKLAKKLGFANGKVAKRALSKSATDKVIAKDGLGKAAKITGAVGVAETAEFVSVTRGISLAKVKSLLSIMTTIVAVPTAVFFAFAQYIDFANWQGPYQRYFQNLLAKLGINPDTPMPKSNVVSADVWKRIYSTVEELEPIGISFPYSGIDKPYSRLDLANLIDEVGANMAKSGVSTSYKNVLGAALPLIQLKNKERTDADIDKIFSKYAVAPANASVSVSVTPITKVFTGIVSQGVVGQGLVFEARPDDMIDSADELRQAAGNNLAPYLNTLLGKIVYEVKVVSSIITKEGFKQTGTTQRIKTGTDKYGNAQYKTVTNKFATLTVYALTDKGSRAKLTTIVLGPVNSAKLVVGQNDLRTLESSLPAIVTTTNIDEIKGIETASAITITTPPAKAPEVAQTQQGSYWLKLTAPNGNFQLGPFTNKMAADTALTFVDIEYSKIQAIGFSGSVVTINPNLPEWKDVRSQSASTPASVPATAPAVSSTVATGQKPGANATTLYEWYQAQGQSVPSVQARSLIYAGFNLGQSSYYTGTAEQNTKLLNALKAS